MTTQGKNQPNKETLKVFKETEQGIGLVKCDSFEDFVKKLGMK